MNRARAAARAGDLDQAGRLLDELDATGQATPASLDLRARVHAQRSEWDAADQCWASVQAVVPDDPAAAAGRRAIEQIRTGQRRPRPLVHPGWGAAAAAVLAGALLAGAAVWLAPEPADPAATPAADPAQAQAQAEAAAKAKAESHRASALEQRLASLDADRAAAADRRARALDEISRELALPGVLVHHRAEDVQVVFETGLFPHDTQLSQAGATLLTEIGRRLATLDVTTTVVGHAVAVPGGRTSGGSVVALARAQVAAAQLAAGGGLPLTAFTLASAEQSDGPFPDAPRNRTVTLLLSPK